MLLYIWSKILSSSRDVWLKRFETTSPKKLPFWFHHTVRGFAYNCWTSISQKLDIYNFIEVATSFKLIMHSTQEYIINSKQRSSIEEDYFHLFLNYRLCIVVYVPKIHLYSHVQTWCILNINLPLQRRNWIFRPLTFLFVW